MTALRLFLACTTAALYVASTNAQAPKPAEKPAEKKADKKESTSDKREKGTLPQYWKQLGVTDEQVQRVYKMQKVVNDEIDEHESKIKLLKEKLAKDRMAILTKEQKERLEAILKEKAGGEKK